MNKIFKRLINYVRFSLIYTENDWIYKNEKDSCDYSKLPSNKGLETKTTELYFKTRKKLKAGWYFFCVNHRGNNPRVIGYISSKNLSFKQWRSFFPNKNRWRIIRINRKSHLQLCLTQVNKSLIINNILLIPIPFIYSKNRIKNRLKEFESISYIKTLDRKRLWKAYNKLFLKQIKTHSNKFSYMNWQNYIENNLINKLINYKLKHNYYYKKTKYYSKITNNINEFIIIKDENTKISKHGLKIISYSIDRNSEALLLYGDEDYITNENTRISPIFKPAWNKELFWSNPRFSNIWIINSKVINLFLSYNIEKIKLYDISLIIKIVEVIEAKKQSHLIKHIPYIIAHRTKDNTYNEIYLTQKASILRKIINKKNKNLIDIKPNKAKNGLKLYWQLPKDTILSIIIPTKDKGYILKKCINSIKYFPPNCKFEIIIVDNQTTETSALTYLNKFPKEGLTCIKRQVLKYEKSFNYSSINNFAFTYSIGSIILLLNNDIEFTMNGWGKEMASYAARNEVGCVGAKLIYPNNEIQHAGVILGIGGIAGHSHKYYPSDDHGYNGRLQLNQELSAVTGACLALKRSLWNEVGGLDEKYAVNYNDVDLCLRINELGYKNIYLPEVIAIHHESVTRGKPQGKSLEQWKREAKSLKKRWNKVLLKDRAYNPHLTLKTEDWSLGNRINNISIR